MGRTWIIPVFLGLLAGCAAPKEEIKSHKRIDSPHKMASEDSKQEYRQITSKCRRLFALPPEKVDTKKAAGLRYEVMELLRKNPDKKALEKLLQQFDKILR